jgi:hypothetical protein
MKYILNLLLVITLISCGGDDSVDGTINQNTGVNPVFSISEVTNITFNSAEIAVGLSSDSDDSLTEFGIIYGTTPNPTIGVDFKLIVSNEVGDFVPTINDLLANTTYYVRGFANFSSEIFYSEIKIFSTVEACDSVFEGDITIYNQEELNNFGLNNYCKITGTLTIDTRFSPDPIINFSAISELVSIGTLNIESSEGLVDFTGLENLIIIERDLSIDDSSDLLNIDALSNLQGPIRRIFIEQCPLLENLNGLSGIRSLLNESSFGITIRNCNSLENLNGLHNLTQIYGGIDIGNNNSLTSIAELSGITSLPQGALQIYNNDNLLSFNGLQNISSINDILSITANDRLIDISALSNLTSFARTVRIVNNLELMSLNGLQNLIFDETKKLEIVNNSSLVNFVNFENITTLDMLIVTDNDALESLSGLSGLNQVRRINIEDNISLLNLNGLDNVSAVNTLDCTSNIILSNLCALTKVVNSGTIQNYQVSNNAYNPSQQDIIDGNCSL